MGLKDLADALRQLSPEGRATLAQMLSGNATGQGD